MWAWIINKFTACTNFELYILDKIRSFIYMEMMSCDGVFVMVLFGLPLVMFIFVVIFSPSYLANGFLKTHRSKAVELLIFLTIIINLLIGWNPVGWVIALIWSVLLIYTVKLIDILIEKFKKV